MRMPYKGIAMAYESTAAKKPVNLSVNSDLLRQAKELKVNVSQVLEVALASKPQPLPEEDVKAEPPKPVDAAAAAEAAIKH